MRMLRVLCVGFVLLPLALLQTAEGAVDPMNQCVARKMKAAAVQCVVDLRAWSGWAKNQDPDKRDQKLAAAAAKLADAWQKAESTGTNKGVNCALPSLTGSEMTTLIETEVSNIVTDITQGLDLGNKADAKCAAKLMAAAGKACVKLIKAEGAYHNKPERDLGAVKRASKRAKVSELVAKLWAKAGGCPTGATQSGTEQAVVMNTAVSPRISPDWTMVTPPTTVEYLGQTLQPICSRGTPYVFFARRGSVNKLLMYYQGGGACWDNLTCQPLGVFKETTGPGDNPAFATSGLADMSNPENPFRDWNVVLVTYCTGDVHWGDATFNHGGFDIEHRGFVNVQVAEKYAREHFVSPEEVFVAGSSAGVRCSPGGGLPAGACLFWGRSLTF